MVQKSVRIILFFAVVFLSSSILTLTVDAIEYGGIGGKPAYPDSENPRSESIFIYKLEPGEEESDGVLVVNNTKETKTLLIYATDSQKSTDGSFACEQLSDTRDKVGAWIGIEKAEVTLKASKNEIVPFTIHIPENASVGEENGCILIQEKKDSNVESGVALSFRTGLRVVVTIPGEQIRELEIRDFKAINEEKFISSRISVKNNGNVSVDAKVKVHLQGLLNTTYSVIENSYPILRDDTSIYNFEINKPFWGGVLYITSYVEYDDSQEASVGIDPENSNNVIRNSETITLFIPPEPLALAVVISALIVILIIFTILIRKQNNKKKQKMIWTKEYIVKDNEDLQSIAFSLNLQWRDIVKYNRLTPPYSLKKGQKILVAKKPISK